MGQSRSMSVTGESTSQTRHFYDNEALKCAEERYYPDSFSVNLLLELLNPDVQRSFAMCTLIVSTNSLIFWDFNIFYQTLFTNIGIKNVSDKHTSNSITHYNYHTDQFKFWNVMPVNKVFELKCSLSKVF
jgi:hypothetical protein